MPTFVVGSGVGDNYATLLLPMVDTSWFKQALLGALFELTNPNNWREMGDVATSFAVEEAAKMIEGLHFMAFNPFPIGIVIPFAGDVAPDAYLLCDGTSYLTEDYPELFAIIAYIYGGSGDNFNVPDLRGRTVVAASDSFPLAAIGGEEAVLLTLDDIPSHTHSIPLTATTLAVEPGEVTVLTPVPFFTQETGSAGGDGLHNNMQPYANLNYCIYAGRIPPAPVPFSHTYAIDTDLDSLSSDDGTWEAGVGWHSVDDPTPEIDLIAPTSSSVFDPHITTLTRMIVHYTVATGTASMDQHMSVRHTGGGSEEIFNVTASQSGDVVIDTGVIAIDDVTRVFVDLFSDSSEFTLTEITIEGLV